MPKARTSQPEPIKPPAKRQRQKRASYNDARPGIDTVVHGPDGWNYLVDTEGLYYPMPIHHEPTMLAQFYDNLRTLPLAHCLRMARLLVLGVGPMTPGQRRIRLEALQRRMVHLRHHEADNCSCNLSVIAGRNHRKRVQIFL